MLKTKALYFIGLLLAVFLSGSLIDPANAAPASTSGKPKSEQGLKNARKSMQYRIERYKKFQELKKQAYAMRQKAQSKNDQLSTAKEH